MMLNARNAHQKTAMMVAASAGNVPFVNAALARVVDGLGSSLR
jgi:hypothetical protein